MRLKTFFHASNNDFTAPTYQDCLAHRSGHENGGLGLWFSTIPDWTISFGRYIYAFELNLDVPHVIFTVEELRKLSAQPVNYEALRDTWLSEGYKFMLLQEAGGNIDMGVVLDFDSIRQFRKDIQKGHKNEH